MSISAKDAVANPGMPCEPYRPKSTGFLSVLDVTNVVSGVAAESVDIVAISLQSSIEHVCAARSLLTGDERARADRFVFDRDRNRYIIARACLRQLLSDREGIDPASLSFTYGPHGKPALTPGIVDADVRFNVSHAADIAVYAFARGGDVGIDVEYIRDLTDRDAVAGRYFSAGEQIQYFGLDPADRLTGFFNCWTRKEAFIKAIGEGLSHPLDSFEVTLSSNTAARIVRVGNLPGDQCDWLMESFTPAPRYVAAVVFNRTCVRSRYTFKKMDSGAARFLS